MTVDLLFRRIDNLFTMQPDLGGGPLGRIEGAALGLIGGRVAWVGADRDAPDAAQVVDCSGMIGLPGLVDAHTHMVWAGSRAAEFEQRLGGAHYSEILEAGGGILSTVRATRAAGEGELRALAEDRLRRALAQGITTVEIKSGYGLDPVSEAKMLRVARAAGEAVGVRVLTTFLGAHAVPLEYRGRREAYVEHIIAEQLPAVVGLADFIDVYVDRGAFTLEEAERILRAGIAAGLRPRVHAEQVEYTGAAALAARLGATSADHLERLDQAGVEAMAAAGTVAVLLPGAMLYLRDSPPPVEALRAAGVPIALATDLNPGSSPVADLWTIATLGCLSLGLTVEEAVLGITRNAALALGRPALGHLGVGAAGDLILVRPPLGEPPLVSSLVQRLGGHRAEVVVRDGEILWRAPR
ncbi:MAG: imidazolonepropionase [Deltaproteobacteria bacterium]|nr:imidazolonepropionase [Deltaproteobacteria bacterium]